MSTNDNINAGTILVPLKGNSADAEVMRWACSIARKSRKAIYAVNVVVVKQELALETELPEEVANGEKVLEAANEIAQEYGVEIETGILQARSAGVAIVEEAIVRSANLIIMAVSYRNRKGDFNMGKTVPYVLKNAPGRIWVYRGELQKELA
jgi:nucleotide-binding universal stress UspA family protein